MRLYMHRAVAPAAAFAVLLFAFLAPAASSLNAEPFPRDDDPRVFLKLVDSAPLPFDQVSETLESALAERGWTVVGKVDCGVDGSACDFRSRVFVAYTQDYLERVMAYGSHAAFAVPVRFVVWEDEGGVSVGATNPMNLNRTIVDEETEPEDWADVAGAIRAVTAGAFPEWAVTTEYGQKRGKARIGRTLGIMAGGKFTDKLKDVVTRPANGDTPAAVASRISQGLASVQGDWEWGIRPVYVIDMPEHGITLLGVTGDQVEARSFSIVGKGSDDSRKNMACPGIDHAAAYPVEVSIAVVDGELQIRLVDEMYRMKMFFEDAGKMSFAKNMGMPGSIEDEIKDKIRAIVN